MKWCFSGQRAPAILDSTAQADIVRALALCRIVRRGDGNENGIVLHVSKLGGADQAMSGTGERRADHQNVGYLDEFIESIWCSDPSPLAHPSGHVG